MFSDRELWSVEILQELDTHFVKNPDEGSGSFLIKLEQQLLPTPPTAKQLASEMLWLMLLCPSNTLAPRKRGVVAAIWQWSGEELPTAAGPLLTDEVLRGIGSAGTAYNTARWRELVFLITLLIDFKRRPQAERAALLGDGWAFAQWLESVPDAKARQFRHMLLFMLFPDDFERIFGKEDRRAVAIGFSGLTRQTVNALPPAELDRVLRRVRAELEAKHGTADLDFYEPPLAEKWKPQDFRVVTETITSDHVLQALAEIDRDGVPVAAESTFYDLLYAAKRYPPKLVLSLAAKRANGVEFDRSQFTGGEDSSAFRLLRALGFEIVPKAVLPDVLKRFLDQAASGASLAVSGYPSEYRGLDMKVSFGKGNQAKVPWIGFLGTGHTPTKGCYPVALYYREAGMLVVAYGVSETNESGMLWGEAERKRTVEAYFAETSGRQPERYGDSYVAEVFQVSKDAPIAAIAQAIDRVIDIYKPLLSAAETVQEPPATYSVQTEEEPYTVEDAVEGLFLDQAAFGELVSRLRSKRNLILQGPPGVGKTHFARRLAMALVGSRSSTRVAAVQFHQTYSYEDFVQGYRPNGTGFQLKNGLFHQFCRRAQADPHGTYVFIIDEINRGNLSKVFGELLMLIEADKRGPEWAIPLTYSEGTEEKFYVPRNLYLLGLMNTADRSLAMVDYALRRRFAFVDLEPGFETPQFVEYMRNARASEELIQRIVGDMRALNTEISEDRANLGPGFCVGHSYFCGEPGPDGATSHWYAEIIKTEIVPLLKEYWFDSPSKVEEWERRLAG